MPFTWKDHKDIWKGEGIYFLTFNVNNRVPLLGKLRKLETNSEHIACVDAYDLGVAVYSELRKLQARYQGFQVIAKQIMPNHFHAVVWCHKEFGDNSIKMVARGFSQACSRIARQLLAENKLTGAVADGGNYGRYDRPATNNNASTPNNANSPNPPKVALSQYVLLSVSAQSNCAIANPYYCGNGANTLFETPYIRTLSHAGQLDRMVKYTHNNPDNLQRTIDNPQYYTIRRNLAFSGLHFDGMGKTRLLDYPDRYVVALSRSLTKEQIKAEVDKALRLAERGTVIYTAAINEGEKAVSKAIRENGYPLVVMMLDGFPAENTEAARYFHPNGVYHQLCGEGLLMLLAPKPENYNNPQLIDLTDHELARKASEKKQQYSEIPHDSKRWRMIAGNVMLKMISEN